MDIGVTLWTSATAEQLNIKNGRITGVRVNHNGEQVHLKTATGIILASGGFEWNTEMMARYFPGPVEWTASPDTNTGDGQRMAAEVGAQLDHMDQALVMGTTPVTYEKRSQHGLPAADYFLPHSMVVNSRGKRFVNEKQMNVGLAFDERDPETLE